MIGTWEIILVLDGDSLDPKTHQAAADEPFHVAVDRQLKSGHETYEAAEKAALAIKKRYPKLHVTVFDAKERRHTLIEQPRLAGASNKKRLSEQATPNTVARHKLTVAGSKH